MSGDATDKKRLRGFAAGIARAAERSETAVERPHAAGNWTKTAVQSIREDLDDLRQAQLQAVIAGELPIRVPIDRIDDPIGSDRMSDEGAIGAESLEALIENIRRRGLRVPLRVRPVDIRWRPNPHRPGNIGEMRFVLQSGRRRLAACRALGVEPLVFLSFVDEHDARREDLQERFFENAARRELTPAEKLFSIGLIAQEYPGMPQAQLAEIIGVSTAYVSRGIALYEHREELKRRLDLARASMSEIDGALARIRAENASPDPSAVRKRERRAQARLSTPLPFETRSFGNSELRLRGGRGGVVTLTVKSRDLDAQALDRIADFVERLATGRRAPSSG